MDSSNSTPKKRATVSDVGCSCSVKTRILSVKQVMELTSLSRSQISRLASNGLFPQSIRLSPNRVGWLEAEVFAWIEEKRAQRTSREEDAK
ncbi:MAG: AlpA family phage regulatory protein [Pseudomonadota bacterium]